MKNAILAALVVLLYALHQDVWNFRTAYPLVLGFLPIGLFYHACYSVVASCLMALLVRLAWPSHIQRLVESETEHREEPGRPEEGGRG